MSMNNETSSSPKKRKKAAETTEDIIKDLMTKLGGVFKKDIYIIQGRTVFPGNISYDMLNGSFICILEDKYQKAISEFIKDGVEMYYVDNITEAKTNFAEHFTPVSNVDEMEHVIHKLRAVRSYMNTIEEWCSFKDFLDDNDQENFLKLFEDGYYVNLKDEKNNTPSVVIGKSLIPLVTAKTYGNVFYNIFKSSDKDLYVLTFDFHFSHFKLYMIYYFIPDTE